MILVASRSEHRVEFVNIEFAKHTLKHILRHVGIIDDTHGLSALTALHALGYFLKKTVPEVVVYFHFGILCKLESIGFKMV